MLIFKKLLSKLRKSDNMRGLPCVLLLFRNKFNNIYLSYVIKIILQSHFWRKKVKIVFIM